jgi:hypothetical protein
LVLENLVQAQNAVGARGNVITVYSDCGGTIDIAEAESHAYEHVAITAFLKLAQSKEEVHVKTDSSGQVWVKSFETNANSVGYYAIVGYYD